MTKAPITPCKTTKRATRATKPAAPPSAAVVGPVDTAPSILPPPRETKAFALRRSLQYPGGASMTSLMAATGWKAHTVRAALSGLRKKGWAVRRRTEEAVTIYFIDPDAPIPDGETDVFRVGGPANPDEAETETSVDLAGNGPAA